MVKKWLLSVLAVALSACGGGDHGDQEAVLSFPSFLHNSGNIGFGDFWTSTGCEGRDLRIAFGISGDCAMRDNKQCDDMPRNLNKPYCRWQAKELGIVVFSFEGEGGGINTLTCPRSIAEIQRGDSNDVFFGRPSYGFGHLTASACEFRRSSGPM